jgi:hypothetical protein
VTFQLVDINAAQSLPPKTSVVLGVVLIDKQANYFASDGIHSANGQGIPADLLGGRVWICDLEYKAALDWTGSLAGKQVRATNWMRAPLRAIMEEWGFSPETQDHARYMAQLVNRVFSLGNEIVVSHLDPKSRDWTINIGSQPSFATALSEALGPDGRVEIPPNLAEANRNGQKLGAVLFGKRGGSADTLWRFQSPRLSHALEVVSTQVPAGEWKMIQLGNMDTATFRTNLAAAGRPALLRVDANPLLARDRLPATLRTWFTSANEGARFWLTGDELMALGDVEGLVIQAAYLAQSTSPKSIFHSALESLRTLNGHAVVAQNLSLPALSWSAGMLSENLLAAAMRKRKDRDDFAPTFLAAQDRILTERRARLLAEAGVSVVSYYLGGVVAQVGRNKESLLIAADAAWRAGLLLPGDFVQLGKSLGVPMAGRPADWGGRPEDLLQARLIAAGQAAARWEFDKVLDLAPGVRNAAFIEILKKLMGKR